MKLSSLFFRSPRLLVLVLLLIAVAGFASFQLLPRAEDPELRSRNSTIYTVFTGADAERVEALVTDEIEDMLAEYEEIKEIKSFSRAGLSTIAIELHDAIVETDPIWTDMRDDLAELRPSLPADAEAPELVEFELAAYTLLVGLRWTLDTPPERAILGRTAADVADALRAVPGTNDVSLRGAPEEELLVEVRPDVLASLGIDVAAVSAAIRDSDAKVAAGKLEGPNSELLVEVSGEIETVARLRDIVVHRSMDGDAARFVRLGDVATITKGERVPVLDVALIDGEPGIVIAARMQVGRRVDVWSGRAKEVVAKEFAALPSGIEGEILFDQSRYTEERLTALVANFVMGVGLVMVVMFFTMGWRAALLVGSALPLATGMTLQGLRMIDVPLHQMSITGMIIALGLLIDNAIVVVDEVRQRLAEGTPAAEAVSLAVRHLAVPLFGSTLTTCLAFAPIALMPGGAGEFVGPIALSVILAVASSLFLALTVTPALAGLLDSAFPPKKRSGFLATGLSSRAADRVYSRVLGFLYRRPVLAVAIASTAPVLGFLAATRMPEQFFPPADRDQFSVQLYLDPTTSIERTEKLARRGREVILENDAVERVHLFLGQSGPKYYYNFVEVLRNAPYFAQAQVQLKSAEGSIDVVREVQNALDAALPEAVVLAQQIEQGPPFDAPVEMHVFGPDLERLQDVGDEVRRLLSELPRVTYARSTTVTSVPKLRFAVDDEAARLVGTTNRGIAAQLRLGLSGAVGGSLVEATEELPVRVRLSADTRFDAERIETLEVATPGGGWTDLSALGHLELVPETAAIAHRNRRRVYSVQGFVEAGTLPSEVLAAFQERIAESDVTFPPGFELEVGGEAAKRDEAVGNLVGSAALLFVLMAASLVLTFNSFRLAGIIGAVGFLSVGLALLAVSTYGAPFGFMTIVGAMGLIGVAINDSIVVLAALQEDEGAARGEVGATVQVVRRATRHVLSTSLTTMAGFTPLILAGGGFWPPLAVAIAGGVAGATLIAVTLVPAVHGVIARRKAKAKRA